jgi:hypothetical protein
MIKIKYVGVKVDGETAFAAQSGIERWMKGDSFEVPDGIATKMLEHPDVFQRDVAIKKAAAPTPTAAPTPAPTPAPSPAPTPAPSAPPVDTSGVTLAPGKEVATAKPNADKPVDKPPVKKAAKKAAKKSAKKK